MCDGIQYWQQLGQWQEFEEEGTPAPVSPALPKGKSLWDLLHKTRAVEISNEFRPATLSGVVIR